MSGVCVCVRTYQINASDVLKDKVAALEKQANQLGLQSVQECEKLAKDRSVTLQLLQKVHNMYGPPPQTTQLHLTHFNTHRTWFIFHLFTIHIFATHTCHAYVFTKIVCDIKKGAVLIYIYTVIYK